jgi:hypothetical protein
MLESRLRVYYLANLQLQVDQRILGPSQRSAQESAGSAQRLRCSFISRYHMESQGCPANEKCFNALKPLDVMDKFSVTPRSDISSE